MIAKEVTTVAAMRIQRGLSRIEKAFSVLDESDIWRDHNPYLVSVGNIVLHLIGNVSQHILSGLGGQDYTRDRDAEFTSKPGLNRAELLATLHQTVRAATGVLDGLGQERLEQSYMIQGNTYTGTGDIMAVLEHFSYHVGQVVFAAKLLKNLSLGLSDDAALRR